MDTERPGTATSPPRDLDADAVCESCGTVNPEDTFLCKQCGNNLRDQKVRRLALLAATESPGAVARGKQLLGKLVVVFGLLLVVWAMINVDMVETWLTQAQLPDAQDPSTFWKGPDKGVFADMLNELNQTPFTKQELNAAAAQVTSRVALAGSYVIKWSDKDGDVVVGRALIRQDDDANYLVAQILPNVELRGEITSKGPSSLQIPNAGVKVGRQYLRAYGAVRRNETGAYACLGETTNGDTTIVYQAIAYPIP